MGRPLAVSEHLKCPFCFGRADDIANGQHDRFCDFTPARDPIHLGLLPGAPRELER
jgi:hypothetical protein